MTLEEALEKSGTANLVDEKTLQATKELIEPNEEILYALYTTVHFMSIFNIAKIEPGTEKGIAVITKNKILFSGELKWEINNTHMIHIEDIKNIEQEAVIFKGGLLRIFSATYKCFIQVKDKKQLDAIKEAIKTAQNMIKEQ